METYRAVGIEPAIEEAAAREFVQNGAIVSVESLGGKELDWYFRNINEGVEDLSPSPRIFITQIGLEPVLLAKAAEVGARVRVRGGGVSLDHYDDGVVATIRPRDGGEDWTVRARYAIAADGAHSPSRERLGIPMLGHGSFSDSITIYFRADVQPLLGDRNLSVIYVFNPRLVGFFRFSIDGQAGFLVVNAIVDEEGNRSTAIGEDMSEDTCVDYVRTALGAPDLADPDRERPALVGDRRLGRALLRRSHPAGRRLRPRDAADRRVRREHGRPGRIRPRLEAGRRARRHGRPGPARHLRRRAASGRRLHGRAGVHALRAPPRPEPRQGRPDAHRRRGSGRARLPPALGRRPGGGRRRRRALGGPARADGASGDARAASPRRPGREVVLGHRPLRGRVRPARGARTAAAGSRRRAVWMFR